MFTNEQIECMEESINTFKREGNSEYYQIINQCFAMAFGLAYSEWLDLVSLYEKKYF